MPAADEVRAILADAGLVEAGEWGYSVADSSQPGLVRLSYVRGDCRTKEGSVRYGNSQITLYVRALQAKGFRVARIMGHETADRLLVMECKSN